MSQSLVIVVKQGSQSVVQAEIVLYLYTNFLHTHYVVGLMLVFVYIFVYRHIHKSSHQAFHYNSCPHLVL